MKPPRLCFCTLRCLMILGVAAFIVMDENNQRAKNESWAVDRLADYMDVLCPYDTICRDGEPKLQITPDRVGQSCCTECSCDESCGLTENCCFPDQDVHTTDERSQPECVAASSRVKEGQPRRDYYMVVDGHPDGTGEYCVEEGNTTCGGNDDATPLGRLYPVTSRANGVIYKNALCALCHGVDKSEQLPWEAVLECDGNNPDINMDTYFQALESGKLPTICKYEFYPPASQTDANAQACYENSIHSCKIVRGAHLFIPEHLNMTEEEVRAACVSDLFSPYLNRYFNAFCAICNYVSLNSNRQCREQDHSGKADPGMLSFSALVDQNFFEEKKRITSEEYNLRQRTACRIQKDHTTDDSDCRPVLCPTGKVRLGKLCVYPSKMLMSRFVMFIVKLKPRKVMQHSSIEIIKRQLRDGLSWKTLFRITELKKWQLLDLGVNETLNDVGDLTINYLVAKFNKVQRSSSLKTIVSNVETIMKKDWKIRVNGHDAVFQPQFFEFRDFGNVLQENQTLESWNEIVDKNLPPFVNELFKPTLKRLLIESFTSKYPSITKMMFCDQVALEKDEYLLDGVFRRLYVNATGRLFFPLEFSLGYDRNADLVPKLCLEDAGFALQSNTASGVPVTILALVKLTVVSILLQ